MSSAPVDIIGNFNHFLGVTLRRFKCSQFGTGTLNFNFECIRLLQNDFCKQRYITLNATISGQDRIYPKTHLCRTFFAEYIIGLAIWHILMVPIFILAPLKVKKWGSYTRSAMTFCHSLIS